MAVNRVGKKGPRPTSAASELRRKGLGNQGRMSREAKGRGFLLVIALVISYGRQTAMHKLTAISMDLPTSPLRRAASIPLV